MTLEPRAARRHRAQHELAELRPLGGHVAQLRAIERDHVCRCGGDAGGDRRLAGEHGDVADERVVLAREPDVLVGSAIQEVDQAALDDEARRVTHALVEEKVALLERATVADLREPLQLGFRQRREEDLIAEIRKGLGLHATPHAEETSCAHRSDPGALT
jgi:hypothetical protein